MLMIPVVISTGAALIVCGELAGRFIVPWTRNLTWAVPQCGVLMASLPAYLVMRDA